MELLLRQTTLKVLQWNCRALNSNKVELLDYAHQNQPDIIALQDANFPKKGPVQLVGYQFPPMHQNKGKVATYIKQGLTATEYQTTNTDLIDSIGTQITLGNNRKIRITNIYVNNHANYSHIHQTDLDNLYASGDLIVGNLNARNPLWDESADFPNKGGRMVEDAVDHARKVVINNGEATHFHCRGRTDITNALDVTA